MYAMPLNRFVLLHVINLISRTLPTLEKNSSKSRDRIRWDSCIQKTVRASRSSGLKSSGGERSPKPFGGVRPRRNGRGDGERCLQGKWNLESLCQVLRISWKLTSWEAVIVYDVSANDGVVTLKHVSAH